MAGPAYAYLADHQVGGVPVVPVATVLDWFAGAARAWRPTANSIAIRDLRVLDKISLPRLADGGHRLIVRGREAERRGGPGAGPRSARRDRPAALSRPRGGARAADPRPLGRSCGPGGAGQPVRRHDPVPRAEVSGHPIRSRGRPAGAQATVAGSRALGWEGSSRQIDPAAVDGGLQLAVLWASQAGAGRTLPMAISECRVHRPGAVEAEVRCVVIARRADDVDRSLRRRADRPGRVAAGGTARGATRPPSRLSHPFPLRFPARRRH